MLLRVKNDLAGAVLARYTRFVSAVSTQAQMILLREDAGPRPEAAGRTVEHIWHIQNCITQNTAFHLNLNLRFLQGQLAASAAPALGIVARQEAMTLRSVFLEKRDGKVALGSPSGQKRPGRASTVPPGPAAMVLPVAADLPAAIPPSSPEALTLLFRKIWEQRDIRRIFMEYPRQPREPEPGYAASLPQPLGTPPRPGREEAFPPEGRIREPVGESRDLPPAILPPGDQPASAALSHPAPTEALPPARAAQAWQPERMHSGPGLAEGTTPASTTPGKPVESGSAPVRETPHPGASVPETLSPATLRYREDSPAGPLAEKTAPSPGPAAPPKTEAAPPWGKQGPFPLATTPAFIEKQVASIPRPPLTHPPVSAARQAADLPPGDSPLRPGAPSPESQPEHTGHLPQPEPQSATLTHPAAPREEVSSPRRRYVPKAGERTAARPEGGSPPAGARISFLREQPSPLLQPRVLLPAFATRAPLAPVRADVPPGAGRPRPEAPSRLTLGHGPAVHGEGRAMAEVASAAYSPTAPDSYAPAHTLYRQPPATGAGGLSTQADAALPEIKTVHRKKTAATRETTEHISAPAVNVRSAVDGPASPETLQQAVEQAVEQIDLGRITDRVYRELSNRLRSERKKRGL